MKRLPMRKIRDVLRLSAEGLSTRQIAASLPIGRTTLRGYLERAEGWSSGDKFAVVLETATLNEADLAEYCRKRGLFPEQIKTWRMACEQANDWPS